MIGRDYSAECRALVEAEIVRIDRERLRLELALLELAAFAAFLLAY
jgi:hypothetical protein